MEFKQQSPNDTFSLSDSLAKQSENLAETASSLGSPEESMKVLFSYYINFTPDFQSLLSKELDLITESLE